MRKLANRLQLDGAETQNIAEKRSVSFSICCMDYRMCADDHACLLFGEIHFVLFRYNTTFTSPKGLDRSSPPPECLQKILSPIGK